MRFRMGVMLGFAGGYVLGSKAGRERYEQIRQMTQSMLATDTGQKVKDTLNVVQEKAVGTIKGVTGSSSANGGGNGAIDLSNVETVNRVGAVPS